MATLVQPSYSKYSQNGVKSFKCYLRDCFSSPPLSRRTTVSALECAAKEMVSQIRGLFFFKRLLLFFIHFPNAFKFYLKVYEFVLKRELKGSDTWTVQTALSATLSQNRSRDFHFFFGLHGWGVHPPVLPIIVRKVHCPREGFCIFKSTFFAVPPKKFHRSRKKLSPLSMMSTVCPSRDLLFIFFKFSPFFFFLQSFCVTEFISLPPPTTPCLVITFSKCSFPDSLLLFLPSAP